jgi:thymidylate synthase (FAD)
MTVKLQWATPDIDKQIMFQARVSNPEGQNSENTKLLFYCMKEGHVSPFDMANVCLEINSTRDIIRQVLRHDSIKKQEFSQRYQTVDKLDSFVFREFRAQHPNNRQLSVEVAADDPRHSEWELHQRAVLQAVEKAYDWCLKNDGAKETARIVLSEGMTPSRAYFNGTLRSWIFYLKARLDPSTQKEHRILAQQALVILREVAPITMAAFFPEGITSVIFAKDGP